ncbi:cyclophilin-like fold protein [Tessaracoccus aquimaris]|uniref:cyclophilin-like fold protein n=1 Tax=Tessaracoccus aquimaris TaxID=1332264 RepID=UPI000988B97E|nr:cyclophilin-like fold protein [Tessaracoccus aquimaris]
MRRGRTVRIPAALAALAVCAGMAACSSEEQAAYPSSPPPTSAAPSPTATPTREPTEAPEPEEPVAGTAISIVVDGQRIEATFGDNPAAQSLVDQLPVTLEFSPYGGQEVTATPPQPITMEGMPEGDAPVAGDIGYYAPDGVVTFHFTDIGYWTGSARLGQIHGDFSILQNRSGPFSVTIELAD